MRKIREESKTLIMGICFVLLLLHFSFFFSVVLLRCMVIFDFLGYLFEGYLFVVMSKLSIVLMSYHAYMKRKNVRIIFAVVGIGGLFSFLCLLAIGMEYVTIFCGINTVFDMFLLLGAPMFADKINRKIRTQNKDKRRKAHLEQIQEAFKECQNVESCKSNDLENLHEIEKVVNPLEVLHDLVELDNDFLIQMPGDFPMIIGKELEEEVCKLLRGFNSESKIFNISSMNKLENELIELRQFIDESTFDSIVLYSKGISRLEFLEIFEVLKELPFLMVLMGEDLSLVPLDSIEKVMFNFPLKVSLDESPIVEKVETLILCTGIYCTELVNQLQEWGIDSITVIDKDSIIHSLSSKVGLRLIDLKDEEVVLAQLQKGYRRIFYGLPIVDVKTGENDVRKLIRENILFTQKIIECIPIEKRVHFLFLSSFLGQNSSSALGRCYEYVEEMIKAFGQLARGNYQVVRLPGVIGKENGFLRHRKDLNHNKVVEVDPQEVFVHLCYENEVIELLLHYMNSLKSFELRVGRQVYLPELYNGLIFSGIWEEKVVVTFPEGTVPLECYMEGEYPKNVMEPLAIPLSEGKLDYREVQERTLLMKNEQLN